MSTLHIPTPLRPYCEGRKEIELHGDDVAALLELLVEEYPDVRQYLYDEQDILRPYVNLFLNGEDTRNLEGEKTPVGEGDKLRIVPSIAGGCAQCAIESLRNASLPVLGLDIQIPTPYTETT
jgi:adenylyltransferase/sulfurtransferase